MQLKSAYINPEHKKALEELERYLSDIAGEPVEAVEVESEEEILRWEDDRNIFKFLLDKKNQVVGLKIIKFKEVPALIFKLISQFRESLEYLNLRNNKINNIKQIKRLIKLKFANLMHNKINDLEPLQELNYLEDLKLWSNQVNNIEPLKKLSFIKKIDLRNNQIRYLPEWTIDRDWFNPYYLKNNPLEEPPWEVVKQGREAVRKWFEQQKKYGKEIFYNAKILIVGKGKKGKTTLLKKLKNPDFKPTGRESETHGINIETNLTFPNPEAADYPIHTTIWDFGGQHLQYFLHHYFLTSDALFVLLTDARSGDDGFRYWFRAIDFFGGPKPKVLVVFNRFGTGTVISPYEIIAKYSPFYPHFEIDHALVDLKENDSAWQEFQNKLINMLRRLPTFGQDGIKAWNTVQIELSRLEEPYITTGRFKQIAVEKAGMDEKDIDFMLDYFNRIGVLLHYRSSSQRLLNKYIFIKPQWLIDALYAPIEVLSDKRVDGVVAVSWLEDFWTKKGYTQDEIDMFISLFQEEKFEVAFKLDDRHLLFPGLLQRDVSQHKWAEIPGEEHRITIDFGSFLPESIFIRFAVRMHKLIQKDGQGNLQIGKSNVILGIDSDKVFVSEHPTENKIIIRVKGKNWAETRWKIVGEFESIFKDFSKKPQVKIPCTCDYCTTHTDGHEFAYDDLVRALKKGKRTKECPKSDEDIDILKLLYGYEMPEHQAQTLIQQHIHGDYFVNSKINKTEINGDNNTVLVDVQAQTINIEEIIPAIAGNKLKDREFRELKETLELFRTETAINLEQLGKYFVEQIFDIQDQITDDIKQAILSSAQQARNEKSPFVKFGISLSILKVLETFGIIPPGFAEVLEGVNLSASSDAKLKLKQLFRI